MNKRGASRLVNTIILIAFIIALIIIAILWAKNYLEELAYKRGEIAKKQIECKAVDLSIYDIDQQGFGKLSITLNNKGTRDINKLSFRIKGDVMQVNNTIQTLNSSRMEVFIIPYVQSDVGAVKEIEVIPWIRIVPGKYIPCSEKTVIREYWA